MQEENIQIHIDRFMELWDLLQDASRSIPLFDTQTQAIVDKAEQIVADIAAERGVML